MADSVPNRLFLSLGSNIDPEINLPAAVRELQTYGQIVRVSRVWETAPVGFADQLNFLNAALLLETSLSATEFQNQAITRVESALKRVRDPQNKNGPRTIDIDIALFNQDVLQLEHRRIPDPDILSRPFIAVPLAELDPEYRHPVDGRTLAGIADGFRPDPTGMQLRSDVNLHQYIA